MENEKRSGAPGAISPEELREAVERESNMENEKRSGAPGAVSPEELREAAAQLKKMAKLEESMARADYLEKNFKPVRRTGDAGSRKPMDEKRSGVPEAERTDMGSGFVHQVFLGGPAASGQPDGKDGGQGEDVVSGPEADLIRPEPGVRLELEPLPDGNRQWTLKRVPDGALRRTLKRVPDGALRRTLEKVPEGTSHMTVELQDGRVVYLSFLERKGEDHGETE